MDENKRHGLGQLRTRLRSASSLVSLILVAAFARSAISSLDAFTSSISGSQATRLRSRECEGSRRKATLDDLEDVVLIPWDEDDIDLSTLTPEALPDVKVAGPLAQQIQRGEKPELPPLDGFSPPTISLPKGREAEDLLVDGKRSLTGEAIKGTELSLTFNDEPSSTVGTKGAKRWLQGRGSQKRKKLEENNALEAWLVKNGVWISERADWGQSPSSLSIAVETKESTENEISGRGLIASRDINHFEQLARVPSDLLFTRESAQKAFGPGVITNKIRDYAVIALQLIWEKYVLKEDSKWAPYMAVLPSTEEVGASWTWPEEDLQTLLKGSPLLNVSCYIRDQINTEYKTVVEDGLAISHPELFTPDAFTLENYVWAYSIVYSRVASLKWQDEEDEFLALVPYLDLFNHNPGSTNYFAGIVDGVKLPFSMTDEERCIAVYADRYYSKYEQIYINYGLKSNSQLLLLYGFSMERNPQDFVEVGVGQLLENCSFAEVKKRILDERSIERNVFPVFRDRFVADMMMFLRLVTIEPEDVDLVDAGDDEAYDVLKKIDLTTPTAETSERKSLLLLRGLVQELMADYPTTIQQDEALLQDRTMFELLPKNQRHGIRVRYGEKLVMRATLSTIDNIMKNLGRLTEVQTEQRKQQMEAQSSGWGRLGLKVEPAFRATNLEELMKELDI